MGFSRYTFREMIGYLGLANLIVSSMGELSTYSLGGAIW